MNLKILPALVAGFLLAGTTPCLAWPGSDCAFKAERTAAVDLAGARSILIRMGAGDLKVRGLTHGSEVKAHGKACAPSQALLDQTTLKVVREGDVVHVSSQIPEGGKTHGLLFGNSSPYIDVDLDLPAEVPIALEDTSGDLVVTHIAGGSIHDSSGDLEVDDVAGDLDVVDSSGDIRIGDVRGKLTLEDSSGDMNLRNVHGDVLVKVDSSGDIRIVDAGANVTIDRDSSGDVDVDGVAGNFTLGSKGSGDVNVHGVHGKVSIPDYKKD
ncbi:MAG: DUF4097 family beta strand repeat-containing protein [Steroidobacteraceae bacterium]